MSDLVELLKRLVAIDSVNPDLVAGGAGEGEIARFVASWFEDAGLEVELEEVAPGRPNVVAIARGTGGGPALMLNAHMDTVGYAGMERPLEPQVRDGRLYGRGAYDMKASLAAIMLAGMRARMRGLRGDVLVTAVCDEEVASIGTEAVARRYQADAAIVSEPTEMRPAVSHKGFAWLEIATVGKAAHGSRPDLGVDAIGRMGPVLVRVEELDRRLRAGDGHALLGTGSLHASVVEGGTELSTYPAGCRLRAERRTIPGETREQVEDETRGLLGDSEGSARVTFWRDPFEVNEGEAVVQTVRRHAGDPKTIGVPFWADSAILDAAGIPTVLFGPSGEGAHAVEEWVSLEDAERCAEIYLGVAEELCA
jgi:acetylornithine deacetylase